MFTCTDVQVRCWCASRNTGIQGQGLARKAHCPRYLPVVSEIRCSAVLMLLPKQVCSELAWVSQRSMALKGSSFVWRKQSKTPAVSYLCCNTALCPAECLRDVVSLWCIQNSETYSSHCETFANKLIKQFDIGWVLWTPKDYPRQYETSGLAEAIKQWPIWWEKIKTQQMLLLYLPPSTASPLSNSSLPQTNDWKIRGTQALLYHLGCSQMQLLILNCQTAVCLLVPLWRSQDSSNDPISGVRQGQLLACYRRYYSISFVPSKEIC